MIGELRTSQLKIIEASKVSAAAALSAGILHQISQPITAVHGFIRFMKQEMKSDDKFYRPICLMEEQSTYLKEMLENLLLLIRHRKIEKARINVNAVLERSINLLVDELRIRRIHWELKVDPSMAMVWADGIHLQQIFMNITINAMDALSSLPRGAERNLLIRSEYNGGSQEANIYFYNNGPAIPLEDRTRIFEPFYSTKDKGVGIGLALCQDLLSEHGGSLSLGDEAQGATFIIKLPCLKS